MSKNFLEAGTRGFNPISGSGLTDEARDAVNAALKAMSTWRNELVETSEKHGKRVIDKLAAAATALGWPEQVVDAARIQMKSTADMQIKTMDQVMDAWEEQLKLPDPKPAAMLSKLKSAPGFVPAGTWPTTGPFQNPAMNPWQFWMQFADEWQKSWVKAMTDFTPDRGR